MKKSFLLSLAVLLALPLAAQETETLAPLPNLSGERVSIALAEGQDGDGPRLIGSDNFPSPNANAQAASRREAVKQQLAARKQGEKTHEVARGQYVEFPVDRTDRIFVMLVEYGTQGRWITSPSTPVLSQTAGPLHNTIPD